MHDTIDRRQFLALAGLGGAVFASGLAGFSGSAAAAKQDFFFVQVTDTHWGYKGPANPEAANTLQKAVAVVNALEATPDFIVFTGDLTHTTDDGKERRRRLAEFRDIVAKLKVKDVKFMPGEHDAALDRGAAYQEFFGPLNYAFDHKGVHFIGMNSILVPDFWTKAGLSPEQRRDWFMPLNSPVPGVWGTDERQREWLKKDVARLPASTPIVIFTHSPLWDYYPRWNFQVSDSKEIRATLAKFTSVMAFHGHVHHTVYNKIGNLTSIGTMSTSWPWPYPPVKLPYPDFQQYRADPGNTADGMGTATIAITGSGTGTMQYAPFAESVPQRLVNGFKI